MKRWLFSLAVIVPVLSAAFIAQPAGAIQTHAIRPQGGTSYYYESFGKIALANNPDFCLSVEAKHYNPQDLVRVHLVNCGREGWWQNWSLVRYRGYGRLSILGVDLQISQNRITPNTNLSGYEPWFKNVTYLQHTGGSSAGGRWQINAEWKRGNPGLAVEPHPKDGEVYYATWLTDTSPGSTVFNIEGRWHKCDAAGCD